MIVLLSPSAIDDLHLIWQWNAERYHTVHADAYVRYLRSHIDNLATQYTKGKTVSTRPDMRYLVIRRKTKGHGNIAVYRVADNEIHVLHIFHTAQNWQTTLSRESE